MVSPITVTTVLNQNQEMTDYKKYSLEQLSNWMHDAMSAGEATPQEIYNVIVGVVKENYYTYKQKTSQAYELLALLNSGIDNNKYQDYLSKTLSCDKDDPSPECKSAWNDFWDDVDEKHGREYNLREAEYYNKRAELDANQNNESTVCDKDDPSDECKEHWNNFWDSETPLADKVQEGYNY